MHFYSFSRNSKGLEFLINRERVVFPEKPFFFAVCGHFLILIQLVSLWDTFTHITSYLLTAEQT